MDYSACFIREKFNVQRTDLYLSRAFEAFWVPDFFLEYPKLKDIDCYYITLSIVTVIFLIEITLPAFVIGCEC